MVPSGVLLGHIVSKEGLAIDLERVTTIIEMVPPISIKQRKRCIEKVKWHTRFVRYVAHRVFPLYQLARKNATFSWTQDCHQAFQLLKRMLTTTRVMAGPNWSKIFHVYNDASDRELGSALM